jgi:hypothetical protein
VVVVHSVVDLTTMVMKDVIGWENSYEDLVAKATFWIRVNRLFRLPESKLGMIIICAYIPGTRVCVRMS